MTKVGLFGLTAWASLAAAGVLTQANNAIAQSAPQAATAPPTAPGAIEEIVVTASKREQSINSVGMSINAATGDALMVRQITSVNDLSAIVPGFTATPSSFNDPVYVLRGVGLYDSGLGSSPAVTVYLDQVPLPYSVMTEVAPIDLQRVEVLKGPQGTLFGQNSTGGAINYIAAKPTKEFAAGVDATYSSYNKVEVDGFVSGALTDTLNGRLSLGSTQGGAWQQSLTRPRDTLGNTDILQGRLLLDWQPTGELKLELNLNGFYDGSDTVAPQLAVVAPRKPARAPADLLNAPLATGSATEADWPAEYALDSKDRFEQIALRTDYDLSPTMTLTSITGYEHMEVDKLSDSTGVATPTEVQLYGQVGHIDAAGEEVRLLGKSGPAIWVVGANYDYSSIQDGLVEAFNITNDQPVRSLPPFHYSNVLMNQTVNEYAVFGNIDYELTKSFIAHAGLRGTESSRHATSCVTDPNAATDGNPLGLIDQYLETTYSSLGVKTSPYVPVPPGTCVTLSPAPQLDPGPLYNHLSQGNLAHHLGLDYKLSNGALLYVSDSLGYKAGIITPIVASASGQQRPATQERLQAYEVGVKAPSFEGKVQSNIAAFYYQYEDQQVRSRYNDPVFGLLTTTLNVPRSELKGIDASLEARPFEGLDLSLGGTYIDSKVTSSYIATNAASVQGNFDGARLPYTSKVTLVGDGQYTWPVAAALKAFTGVSFTYHDASNATFNTSSAPAPAFELPTYVVVDLRAGVTSANGTWRLTGFVRNVGDKYYWYSVGASPDTVDRYPALPRTFGVSVSYRFN